MASRVSTLFVCFAMASALFALYSAGVAPLAQQHLRGERRLQGYMGQAAGAGANAAQQGAQYGSQAVGQVNQGVQGAAQQGVEYGGQMHDGLHEGVQQGMGFGHDTLHRGVQYGGDLANHVAQNPYSSINQGLKYNPQAVMTSYLPGRYQFLLLISQIIFAAIYYFATVFNYPKWMGPSPRSCQLQADPAPAALTNTSPSNCCLSFLCPQARAAHTFDRTGVLDYCFGIVAMFCCPFCTLCWANACTDLNPKLGGEPANLISSALCTWCCSCCVIAQDAESLDAATGARTEICGHSGGAMPVPYGGPMSRGPMPGQQMMYPRY